MEIISNILIFIFLLLGLVGSIVPALPGPLLSYVGLLLYHFLIFKLDFDFIFFMGLLVFFVTVLDYFLQVFAVKSVGGGKHSIFGSISGIFLGLLFFPPFGVLVGAFIGAFIGSKIESNRNNIKIAFGALWGFFIGAILKFFISFYIIYFILTL